MGYINLPNMDDIIDEKDPKKQMEKLINTLGILMKDLSELNGYLGSKNITEVGSWKVTNDALISDPKTYPRIVLDPKGKLLGFYTSENQFLEIGAFDATNQVPFITMKDTVNNKQSIIYLGTELDIDSFSGIRMGNLNAPVFINGSTITIDGNQIKIDFSKVIDTILSTSLQSQLSSKASKSSISKTVYVSSASGGAATTPLTITNGVITG